MCRSISQIFPHADMFYSAEIKSSTAGNKLFSEQDAETGSARRAQSSTNTIVLEMLTIKIYVTNMNVFGEILSCNSWCKAVEFDPD